MSEIPPITDPLGRYWHQPDPSAILLDDRHALMSPETFADLAEYSTSQPTGVYEGKRERCTDLEARAVLA